MNSRADLDLRLYHYNPWTDTTLGVCSSFELYRQQPVNFFMQRFSGMTLPVAEFLAHNVFCILDDPLLLSLTKNKAIELFLVTDFVKWGRSYQTPVQHGIPLVIRLAKLGDHECLGLKHIEEVVRNGYLQKLSNPPSFLLCLLDGPQSKGKNRARTINTESKFHTDKEKHD